MINGILSASPITKLLPKALGKTIDPQSESIEHVNAQINFGALVAYPKIYINRAALVTVTFVIYFFSKS